MPSTGMKDTLAALPWLTGSLFLYIYYFRFGRIEESRRRLQLALFIEGLAEAERASKERSLVLLRALIRSAKGSQGGIRSSESLFRSLHVHVSSACIHTLAPSHPPTPSRPRILLGDRSKPQRSRRGRSSAPAWPARAPSRPWPLRTTARPPSTWWSATCAWRRW